MFGVIRKDEKFVRVGWRGIMMAIGLRGWHNMHQKRSTLTWRVCMYVSIGIFFISIVDGTPLDNKSNAYVESGDALDSNAKDGHQDVMTRGLHGACQGKEADMLEGDCFLEINPDKIIEMAVKTDEKRKDIDFGRKEMHEDLGALTEKALETASPMFCFVIRTYWGHGDNHGGGLRRLIRSLQRQSYQRWEAIIIVADNEPFRDLHHTLLDIGDNRVWVFAEWIGPAFKPKSNGTWVPEYHGMLYNLTDDGMAVCPPNTKWVIVTNGDNEYGKGFLERVISENEAGTEGMEIPDIIGFDFYSRYLRPTAPPCERFSTRSSTISFCKPNLLKWCHVDLGSVAISWPKWRKESRSFGGVDGSSQGFGPEHNDGLTIEILVNDGWKARRVTDKCLFVHAPSPQSCAWEGGVWDDRNILETGGGKCISESEATNILAKDENVEKVHLTLVNDGDISVFEGANQDSMLDAKCLRRRDYLSKEVWGRNMLWFGEGCTDPGDLEEFLVELKRFYPSPTDMDFALHEILGNRN